MPPMPWLFALPAPPQFNRLVIQNLSTNRPLFTGNIIFDTKEKSDLELRNNKRKVAIFIKKLIVYGRFIYKKPSLTVR
jgi:hypothetical protein